jgi:thioesterase domain-containing protein
MRPAAYVQLDHLPLTTNGKIDRRALPIPSSTTAPEQAAWSAPRNEVERTLCTLWAQTLKVERVGIDDNFFDIGGHSLLAATLFEQLDRTFGRTLPLATLFEAPTIRELADFFGGESVPSHRTALVPITPAGSLPPVFAVPGIGGNVLGFAELARELGFEQPFFGLQSLGLDGTCEPLERVEDMAAQYLHAVRQQQQHGPYYLLGACFGSTVAYEMAHQLTHAGEEVAFLGLLDPSLLSAASEARPVVPLPAWVKRGVALGRFVTRRLGQYRERMRALEPGERIQYVRHKAQLLQQAVEMRDLFRGDRREFFQQRVTDTNLQAMLRHRHKPLQGRVAAFDILASEHRFDAMSANTRTAWNALSGSSVMYHRLPGRDSGDMLRGDNARATAALLAARLRAARAMTNGHGQRPEPPHVVQRNA